MEPEGDRERRGSGLSGDAGKLGYSTRILNYFGRARNRKSEETNSLEEKTMDKKDGFDLSYRAFEHYPNLLASIKKIYNCDAFPDFKTAYRIKRLCDAVGEELQAFMDLRNKISGNEEEQAKQLQELFEGSGHIKWDRISKEEMSCVKGVSPADLTSLTWIVDPTLFQ